MNDLISIIVPVYNTGDYLQRCVDSIVSQDYPGIEIIIVDDGSTDEATIALCDRLSETKDNIRTFHTANGGSAKARNYGVLKANGEYIGFVDSDDYIEPNMYSSLLTALKNQNVSIAIGGIETVENGRVLESIVLPSGRYGNRDLLHYFFLGQWHSACTNLYEKRLFSEVSFPEKEINEDYWLNYVLFKKQDAVYYNNKVFYHYSRRPGSNTSSLISLKFIDWIRHTEAVLQDYGEDEYLKDEAVYQYLYSNIVLANKSILTLAIQRSEAADTIFRTVVEALKKNARKVMVNKYLSVRYRLYGLMLILCPYLYKSWAVRYIRMRKRQ